MKCSKCGLQAVIIKGKLIKACQCKAPVIADMSAVASGKGGVKG